MPPDETECGNCGAFVIDEAVVRLCRAFGIDRGTALQLFEKGFRHPKQLGDRDVESVLQRNEDGLLYICTNCGSFVAAGDTTCARCGAEFEAEPEPAPTREERDILDLVLCPVCGADNEPTLAECEICGEPLQGGPPPTPAVAAEAKAEPAKPAGVCPTCGRPWPEKAEPSATVHAHPAGTKEGEAAKAIPESPQPAPAPSVASSGRRPTKVARIPKVVRPAPRPPRTPAAPAGPPRKEATSPTRAPPRTEARSPAKYAAASMREEIPKHRRPWTAPPPEFTGSLTAAAAGGLFLSNALGQVGVAWGIAFVLAALTAYVLAGTLATAGLRPGLAEGLLLSGVLLGLSAPFAPAPAAPLFAVAGALPLAFATRRLLGSPSRALLAVAGGAILVELAVLSALSLEYAHTPAWIFGLASAVPWPAAVALEGVGHRRSSLALHRELSRAEQNVARRDYTETLRAYDRAIALGPKGAPGEDLPWYGKGATLILLGRYEEALRAIDKALDINPRNEVAWVNKGNALTRLGRPLDALRCYNAAIKVNPRYEVAWNNKGNTLARLGHYEEALRCYEKALEIDPNYRGSWVNKGYVLAKLGRYDEAAKCADRALRLGGRARAEVS